MFHKTFESIKQRVQKLTLWRLNPFVLQGLYSGVTTLL